MTTIKRKQRFVDSSVQGALLYQAVRHWVFFSVVSFLLVFTMQVFTGGFERPLTAHLDEIWSRYAPLTIVFLVMLPAFIFDLLKLSHRFTGPVAKLRRALDELAAGKPVAPIRFRQHDFWQDAATNFNTIAARLEANRDPGGQADPPHDAPLELVDA